MRSQLLALCLCWVTICTGNAEAKDVYVKGYYTKNGTWVAPYVRQSPAPSATTKTTAPSPSAEPVKQTSDGSLYTYTNVCSDKTYSYSTGKGTCSGHGGVQTTETPATKAPTYYPVK
jgi:hypothetical protein